MLRQKAECFFWFRFVSVGVKLSFVEPGRRWDVKPLLITLCHYIGRHTASFRFIVLTDLNMEPRKTCRYAVLLLAAYCYRICDLDSTFFGGNFEIYFDRAQYSGGALCGYGPTSVIQAEYVLSCFGGPKSGRSLTILNRYSDGITLCNVKLMGKSRAVFLSLVPNCTVC